MTKRTGTKSIPDRLRELGFSSYQDYLRSDHWRELRVRYFRSKLPKRNEEGLALCQFCDQTSGLNLHHKTYGRLGNERLMDVMLVCRDHHGVIHQLERHGFQLWRASKTSPKKATKLLAGPNAYERSRLRREKIQARRREWRQACREANRLWLQLWLTRYWLPIPPHNFEYVTLRLLQAILYFRA
jgi:hypothetical protein